MQRLRSLVMPFGLVCCCNQKPTTNSRSFWNEKPTPKQLEHEIIIFFSVSSTMKGENRYTSHADRHTINTWQFRRAVSNTCHFVCDGFQSVNLSQSVCPNRTHWCCGLCAAVHYGIDSCGRMLVRKWTVNRHMLFSCHQTLKVNRFDLSWPKIHNSSANLARNMPTVYHSIRSQCSAIKPIMYYFWLGWTWVMEGRKHGKTMYCVFESNREFLRRI